jgi:UDP-N-acetylglucosamine 1-carboxyvinyltransferase
MSNIILQGGIPLQGEVEVGGSVNSAIKLIIASLYSAEDVVLYNIPKVKSISSELKILQDLGGEYEWISNNTLRINNSKLHKFEISEILGKNLMTSFLFAGPLLYRFGEATIPLPETGYDSISKFTQSWAQFGIQINFDKDFLYLRSDNSKSGRVEFLNPSHTATDNAILSSIFVAGESTIINISEEVEVLDLINFLNQIGANITFENKKVLKIKGVTHFSGGEFSCVSDSSEVVFFSVLALLTNGNILIKNIDKNNLNSFISFLNKLGADYEIPSGTELRIWNKGRIFDSFDIHISTFPNLISSFTPFLTVLATHCKGSSSIKDFSYKDKFDYAYLLKKMMAKIKIYESGKDYQPCEIIITGPTKLTTIQIELPNPKHSLVLLLASLTIDNQVQLANTEFLDYYFENVLDKISQLGSKIIL